MGLRLGIIAFANPPPGTPLEWAAKIFPNPLVLEGDFEDAWCVEPNVAMIGTHRGRAVVVTQELPWVIVSGVLMPRDSPGWGIEPGEAWIGECSQMGDVLVGSMYSTISSCGHAVFRAGHLVLKVCRDGYAAGAYVRTAEIPAWYPGDPVVMLEPHRACMAPEQLEPIPEVWEGELEESAFLYDENYVPTLAEAFLGAPLSEFFENVKDWLRVRDT